MKSNTHISNVLEGNCNKDRYDAEVKKILSDKTVLSWILKYTVAELDGYPVEDIRECIEGEPESVLKEYIRGIRRRQLPVWQQRIRFPVKAW